MHNKDRFRRFEHVVMWCLKYGVLVCDTTSISGKIGSLCNSRTQRIFENGRVLKGLVLKPRARACNVGDLSVDRSDFGANLYVLKPSAASGCAQTS